MREFSAFVAIPSIADNVSGKVGLFGELSATARTFTKDMRNFDNPTSYPGIELVGFKLADEEDVPIDTPNDALISTALNLSYFLYTQYRNNEIPLNSSKATLVSAIAAEYTSIYNVVIGNILNSATAGKRLVDYVRYDHLVDNNVYRVTLWFSDSAFRTQYPHYHIDVIPPVGDIDRLRAAPADVALAIKSVNVNYVINRLRTITTDYKQTTAEVKSIRWHDPNGSDTKFDTTWTVVIYGNAGNDNDIIKDAIREYIANNSEVERWDDIFPELYSENEFIIMPLWNRLATNSGSDDGIYLSINSVGIITAETRRLIPQSYIDNSGIQALINERLEVMSTSYRGIQLLAAGNPNNIGQKFYLSQMFPDYLDVSTDKPDFARMSTNTQNFVITLLDVLHYARTYTSGSVLPTAYTRAVKGNRTYIGFDYNGFTYYVLTRAGQLKQL